MVKHVEVEHLIMCTSRQWQIVIDVSIVYVVTFCFHLCANKIVTCLMEFLDGSLFMFF